MAVLCVTTGDCVQWAVYSVVFGGTVTGSVCDKTSTVCLWTQWGLCSRGSNVDVLSICVPIPQETCGPNLSSWSSKIVL